MKPEADIFADAVDLPEADRAAFLDKICKNAPAQRRRIDALLANHASAGAFLEKSAMESSLLFPQQKPGDVIGRYTLQRVIGEGGCGVVYLAEQKEPVRRRVALKVIKLGMDTREVIARFEAERQAVAMMNHPDIAQVYDAGATEAGRPFFVMELVEGKPITTFCDEHNLSLDVRLELFARACLAMQHAHQKGIIHRDLKPSNILVEMRDGVPVPKVIDFGIAKATQGSLTDETVYTSVDQFIGTPAYMSPEQADLRELDVDTRSDIYSLGVLLYELLTGRPPFDPITLAKSGLDEIRRVIREVDPPRPSVRFAATADEQGDDQSDSQAKASALLVSDLRGDLDWIVMRCLEKDRDRRYHSAQELADDVRRHLRHEPIQARPVGTSYRARKFVARHRVACASAAAIAAALVMGTVVSVGQAVRATRAERTATIERDAANIARTDALRRQDQAEDLLTFMLGDFRTELQKIGRLQLLDTVGEKAMSYFADLDPRDLTDTALARQAKALTQIGETRMDQARYDEAHVAFSTAHDRAVALVERHPGSGDMLFERAQAEYWIGFVARRRGDFTMQRDWLTRYRDSAIALAALDEKTLRSQNELVAGYHNLAVLDFDLGNLEEALAGFEAEKTALKEMIAKNPTEIQLRYREPDIASWLGTIAERRGDFTEALERFVESAGHYDAILAEDPAIAHARLKLADSIAFTGDIHAVTGFRSAATAAYARAKDLLDGLVEQDPQNRRWQRAAQNIGLKQAALLLEADDVEAAARVLHGCREKLEELVRSESSSRSFIATLAIAWRLEARLLFDQKLPGADSAIERSLDLGESLVSEGRADNKALGEYAQSLVLAGRIFAFKGQMQKAREQWQLTLTVLSSLIAGSNDWRLIAPSAQALVLLDRRDEARPLIHRLNELGYQPIDSLAVSTLRGSSDRIVPTISK